MIQCTYVNICNVLFCSGTGSGGKKFVLQAESALSRSADTCQGFPLDAAVCTETLGEQVYTLHHTHVTDRGRFRIHLRYDFFNPSFFSQDVLGIQQLLSRAIQTNQMCLADVSDATAASIGPLEPW